jgi:hypothetical protein
LIFATRITEVIDWLRRTWTFLSFQISQDTGVARETITLLAWPSLCILSICQCLTVWKYLSIFF